MINTEDIFLSHATLAKRIEEMVHQEGFTYFDAMIQFAADADKSPEELLPFVSTVLLEKIKKSACDEGYAQQQNLSLEGFETDDDTV